MTNDPTEGTGEKPLLIRRGRVDSVDLFEIKESELDIIEYGSQASLQLTIGISLLSAAIGTLTSLITSTFPDQTTKTFVIVFTVVGFVVGSVLLLLWKQTSISVKEICIRIRARIPSEKTITEGVIEPSSKIDPPKETIPRDIDPP